MKLIAMIIGLIFVYAYAFGAPNNNPPNFTCSGTGEKNLFVFAHELKVPKQGTLNNTDLECLQHMVNYNTVKPGCDDSAGAYDYGHYDLDASCADSSKNFFTCINQDDVDIMQDFIAGKQATALDRAIHVQRLKDTGCNIKLPVNCTYENVANILFDLNGDSTVDSSDATCAANMAIGNNQPNPASCKELSDTSVSYSPTMGASVRHPATAPDASYISQYVSGSRKAKAIPMAKWIGDYHGCKELGNNVAPIISYPKHNKIKQIFVNKIETTSIQVYDFDGAGNDLSDSATVKVIGAPANYSLGSLPPKGQHKLTFMPGPSLDGQIINTFFEVTDAIDSNLKTTHRLSYKIDFFKVDEYEPATGVNQGLPDISMVDNGKIINLPDQGIVTFPENCMVGVKCDMGLEVPVDLPSGVKWQAEVVNGTGPHPALPEGSPAPHISDLGDDKFLFSWTPTKPVENEEIRIRFFFEGSGDLVNSAGFFKYYRFNVVDKLGINLIAGYPENDIGFVFTDQNPAYWLNTQVIGGKMPYSPTTYSMAPMPVPNTQVDYYYDGTSYGTFTFDPVIDKNFKFLDGFLGDSYSLTFEATDAEGEKASSTLNLIVSDLRLEFNPVPTAGNKYLIPAGTQTMIKITPQGGIAPISMTMNPNDLIPGTYNLVGNDFSFDASLLKVGEVFTPTFTVQDSRQNKNVIRNYPIKFEIVSSLIIEPRNIAQGTYRAWKDETFTMPFITDNSGPEVAASFYVNGAPGLSGAYKLDTSKNPPLFSLDTSNPSISAETSLTFDFGVNSSLGKNYEITAGIDVFSWDWQIVSSVNHVNITKDSGSKTEDATLNVVFQESLPHMFTIVLPDPGPHADWTAKIIDYSPAIPNGLGGVTMVNYAVNKTHFDFWRVGPAQVGEYTAHFQFTDGHTTIERKLRYKVGEPTDLTFGVSPIAKNNSYVHYLEWGNFDLDLIALKGQSPYNFSIKDGAVSGMSIDQDTDKFTYENKDMILGNNDFTLMVTDGANDTQELDLRVKVSDLQIAFNPKPDEIIARDHLVWNVPNNTVDEFPIATRVDVGTVNRWTFWAGEGETKLPYGSYNFSGILGNVALYPKKMSTGTYTMKLFADYYSHGLTREYTLTFNVGPKDEVLAGEDCEYIAYYDPRPGKGNICLRKNEVVKMDFSTGYPADEPRLNWKDSVQLINLNTYLDPQTVTGDHSFCFVNDRNKLKDSLKKYSDLNLKMKIDLGEAQADPGAERKDMYSTNVFYAANSQSAGPSGAAFFGSDRCGNLLAKYSKYGTYDKFSDVDIEVAELKYVFPHKESLEEVPDKESSPTENLSLNELKIKYDKDQNGQLDQIEQGKLAQDINAGMYPHLDETNIQITGDIVSPTQDPKIHNVSLDQNNLNLQQQVSEDKLSKN